MRKPLSLLSIIHFQTYSQSTSRLAKPHYLSHPASTRLHSHRPQSWPLSPGYQLKSPENIGPDVGRLDPDDSLENPIVYLLPLDVGTGYVMFVDPCSSCSDTLALTHGKMLHPTPTYPIQAPPVKQNAPVFAFIWFLCSFSTVSILIPITIVVSHHDREHCPPKRARKKASRVIYPIRLARDCHHVRTHPRALHASSTD